MSPEEAYRRAKEILLPAGEPVGGPGKQRYNREVSGGLRAAEEMFGKLANLGQRVEDPRYAGESADLPIIGRIGLRRSSRRGKREPTIDVNATIEGVRIKKIKFVE